MVALRTTLFALAALSACACTAQKTVHLGGSPDSHEPPADEPGSSLASEDGQTTSESDDTDVEDAHVEDAAPSDNDDGSKSTKETSGSEDESSIGEEPPPEAALARQALHESKVPQNHLSLAMAVSERASDLPWVMTIENRSQAPILLAAIPSLLRLKLTAPPKKEEESSAPQKSTTKNDKDADEVICQTGKLPKSLSEQETLTLQPGELIFHAFDPRQLCGGEKGLQEGWTAELSYGFPMQTRKRWKGGKLVEEEIEQKAPFAATRAPSDGDEMLPLKFVEAEPFVLGRTYPLSQVSALPEQPESSAEAPDSGDDHAARGHAGLRTPPPPPLRLELENLGASKNPELRLVKLRVRNVSKKSIKIFLRRELITYEVVGPEGSATCAMQPSNRAPDSSQFSTLAPGSSRYFPTRLAEACPPDTWDTPGLYSVSARLNATASGEKHGFRAFTGTATTESPAQLTVTGGKKKRGKKRPFLQVAPSQAPTAE